MLENTLPVLAAMPLRQLPSPDKLVTEYHCIYLGWIGVGWQRHCKTYRSIRELDNQGTQRFVLFFLSLQLAVELDHLCGVESLYTVQGE